MKTKFITFAGLCLLGTSLAQATPVWPSSSPVKIVVPFSAGTGLDVVARGYADELATQTKGTFTVDNRDGAGGTIGVMAALRGPADGNTILFTAHAPFAVSPYMQKAAQYDPVKDFEPIAKIAVIPMVLITGSSSSLNSFTDMVSEAKTKPGKLSYASSGVGTPSHLHVEVVKRELGLDIVSVPYKNTGQAMTDLIGGQFALYMPSFPAALPMLRSGQVKGLAIGSAQRSEVLPDIPTLAEVVKVPGLEAVVWYGFFAPKGTPKDVVARMEAEISRATPKMKERLKHLGAQPVLVTGSEFRQQVAKDAEDSKNLLRALNVSVD